MAGDPIPEKKKRERKPSSYKAEADRLFSQLIRSRGYCERCGKGGRLETSHIYSRRYASVRCDPLNAKCLCSACHRWWHDKPVDAVSWLHEDMSVASLRELQRRAQSGVKVDWQQVVLDLREQLAA
jgi:hypothetical protein